MSNRTVTTLALSALASTLLLACASDEIDTVDRRGEELAIVPVELRPQLDADGRPIPGTLEIDTSRGRMDLTSLIPDRPRAFRSWGEFHEWAAATLNAELLVVEDDHRQSQVSISAGQTLRYDAGRDAMVEVPDVLEAIVGGTFGYIVIDGAKMCTSRTAECTASQTIDPERPGVRHHLPNAKYVFSNGLGIEGATWATHLFVYHSTGAETRQHQGGFSYTTYLCGFFKWCTTTVGSNALVASFTAWRQGGSIFNFGASQVGHNTTSVRVEKVAFGAAYGSQGPGITYLGLVQETTGMCARHHGNDTKAVIDFETADGQHPAGGC